MCSKQLFLKDTIVKKPVSGYVPTTPTPRVINLNRFPAICSGRRSNKIGFGGPKRATEQYHRKIVFPRICNG